MFNEQITICSDRHDRSIGGKGDEVSACSRLHWEADSTVREEQSIYRVDTRTQWYYANKTADGLAGKRVMTKPMRPESYLPLSLSTYKSKIKNWIEGRKQTEWKAYEKYSI